VKTQRSLSIIAISLLCHSFSYAQVQATPEQWAEVEKKMIESRAYIFQGTIIKQIKKDAQLTCSIIQITKIYKGSPQIKLGTIKVITWEVPPGTMDGGISLGRGCTYIIFGNPTNSNAFDSIMSDNSITLSASNSIVFFGDNSAQWGTNLYKPLDSLYSVFKRNGLTVEEEAEQKK
jgi:hypothetical protein